MKACCLALAALLLCAAATRAQENAAAAPAAPEETGWEFNASLYGYFPPEDRHYAQPTFIADRGADLLALRRVRAASAPEEARAVIVDALPPVIAATLQPEELERIRQKLAAMPEPPSRAPLRSDDFRGAAATFLLVFASTFPVVLPFFFVHDAMRALRISNGIAIVLLFLAGYKLAQASGFRPWLMGIVMVGIGVALVGMTMALGG